MTTALPSCTFRTPTRERIIVEIRSEEAYYAGFFRACEMIIGKQMDGVYAHVADADMEPVEQCTAMTQMMMDAKAGRYYSRNWPGMVPLMLYEQGDLERVKPH